MRVRIHQLHHFRVCLRDTTERFAHPRHRAVLYRASDKCQREKRKTINGDDLLWALSTLGFEEYVDPLKLFLTKYRESETTSSSVRNTETRRQIKQEPNQV